MVRGTSCETEVQVNAAGMPLEGTLSVPDGAQGLVLFAHGSGSSRLSPRNRYVAEVLQDAGLATLLFDLLTADEERIDAQTMHLRFNITLLAERLVGAIDWCGSLPETRELPIGLFGASTGAAAALIAAARRQERVKAVVSRGGRPDLAFEELPNVKARTLLIVGEHDEPVIRMNREAANLLRCEHEIEIIPGASHLFEEPGALEEVARISTDWLRRHLTS